MFKHPAIPSLARRVGISVALGLIIAILGSVLEAMLDNHPVFAFESLDDIVIGILAALVVFYYEQRRYRSVIEKIRVIQSMNHHVRNALQISWSPYTEQKKQIEVVKDSVARIEWALREILPGESEDALNNDNRPTPPSKDSKDSKVL